MSKNMLFDGILFDLNKFYKLIIKSNLIENKKIQKYYYKKQNNLKIFKNEILNSEEIDKINQIKQFFKKLNKSEEELISFIIILFENKQILKNLYRFIVMKWNKQKLLLSQKYQNINFKLKLQDINVNYFTFTLLLNELLYFIKQEEKIKTNKLLIFIVNCLIGYYTNII